MSPMLGIKKVKQGVV